MCLAIPARIVSADENRMAEVDIMGVTRKVSLDLVPTAQADDYVLVHAGFAIQVIDEADAKETLELLLQMDMFSEGEFGAEDFIQAAAPEVEDPMASLAALEQLMSEEA
jgi:hydrogenase expression/formation protein HypC